MKRILSLIASIFIAGTVHADCASSLGINFTPNQTTALCSVFGSAIQGSLIPGADNTYDVGSSTLGWRTGYFDTSVITPLVSHATSLALGIAGTAEATVTNDTLTFSGAAANIVGGATSIGIGSAGTVLLRPGNTTEVTIDNGTITYADPTGYIRSAGAMVIQADSDGQRLFTFDASSDTALTQTFGDGGTTAAQTLTLSSSTADADDDSQAIFTAGGAFAADGTRGGYLTTKGNEFAATAADTVLASGSASGSDLTLFAWATDGRLIFGANGSNRWMIESDGDLAQQAAGGNILLATTGTTLAVDSGTAASACKGQVTANGATPVVTNTTCATTGASVFLTKASASTAVNGSCTVTAISNGVSFTIECLATDTGAYNFWILKEG